MWRSTPPERRQSGTASTAETEALLGREHARGTLATDDLPTRKTATERGVPVTGSVGLLVVSICRGEVDTGTANQWLDGCRATRGYDAPGERIEEILGQNRSWFSGPRARGRRVVTGTRGSVTAGRHPNLYVRRAAGHTQ
jgi:hypothetical protein